MAKFCICGEPVGLCVDCYPQNFKYNKEKDEYKYIGPKIKVTENVNENIPITPTDLPKLEKLETNDEYNKKIFNYISELGKMYSSLLKSSKWSEEVKKENKNNFTKIENKFKSEFRPEMGKKKCNKSDCDCHDCGEKKGKRWTAKKFLITIPKTNLPKQLAIDYYKSVMDLKEIAAAQEHHQDGSLHLHLYMEFVAKKNIKSPKYFKLPNEFEKYGNTVARLDTLGKKTKESVFNYLLKEDKNAISFGFDIKRDRYGKLKEKDIWYKFITGEWSIKDIVLYNPSYITKNLEKLFDRVTDNMVLLNSNKYNTKFIL